MRRALATALIMVLLAHTGLISNGEVEDYRGEVVPADVVIDTVLVSNPGNMPDTRYETPGYGSVAYAYNIGKYEVTAGQYTAFLNAVAATDTYEVYNSEMASSLNGCKILRGGSSGSYTYSVAGDLADRPVNCVSWGDAARFANWLHNGQPTGAQDLITTEDGSYFLDGAMSIDDLMDVTREADATWALPTEDEWYKSAYYKGGGTNAGYWNYPTQSDTVPTAEAPIGTDMINGSANRAWAVGNQTDVGAYTAKPSDGAYGTFDQGGNAWEWNETETLIGSYRGWRGGAFNSDEIHMFLHAAYSYNCHPTVESPPVGFRVAHIPEIEEPPILTLEADRACYEPGETVAVTINLSGTGFPNIVGGQFFLEFNATNLTFDSAAPGSPWTVEVFENVSGDQIDYVVGIINGGTGATSGTMTTLTFTAAAQICDAADLVSFRISSPPTRISDENDVEYSVPAGNLTQVNLSEITIDDGPVIAAPDDINVNADAGVCTATLTPAEIGDPVVSDFCTAEGDIVVTWVRSDAAPNLDDPFPGGTTTITWTAQDDCGSTATSEQTVTVLEYNNFVVDIEIEGGIVPGGFTRCITFTLYEACPDTSPLVFEKDVTFSNAGGNGFASVTFDDLPCSAAGYECVTAQDDLHTLLQQVPLSIVSDQYEADFTALTSNMLLQGDYYDDIADWGVDFIDIVDFGVFITEWGANYDSDTPPDGVDGNTPCGVFAVHADANGDGAVAGAADYSFITTNYTVVGDSPCCYTPAPMFGPRSSITVRELRVMGLSHVAAADLNNDGVVDMSDVALFLEGGVPNDDTAGFDTTDVEAAPETAPDKTAFERLDRLGTGARR